MRAGRKKLIDLKFKRYKNYITATETCQYTKYDYLKLLQLK